MDWNPPTPGEYAASDARKANDRVSQLEARVAELEKLMALMVKQLTEFLAFEPEGAAPALVQPYRGPLPKKPS